MTPLTTGTDVNTEADTEPESPAEQFSLCSFPCGLLVTTIEGQRIVSSNQYFAALFGQKPGADMCINETFTAASKVMIESYVMPMLHSEHQCSEIQLTLKTSAGERIPVLVNARVSTPAGLIYWVITAAIQRDSLYQELVNFRNQLELKAENLERLAQTDELTGLSNRRAFLKNSQITLKQASRLNVPCAFLMIDIDDFKDINDEYGHAAGDEVLREIGRIFSDNSRESDTIARLGGEEFAVLTMCPSYNDAQKFAQKLIDAVNGNPISQRAITISIGLAVAKQVSFEQLFKYADEQLYQAKSNGKNRFSGQFIEAQTSTE